MTAIGGTALKDSSLMRKEKKSTDMHSISKCGLKETMVVQLEGCESRVVVNAINQYENMSGLPIPSVDSLGGTLSQVIICRFNVIRCCQRLGNSLCPACWSTRKFL
jgi:hypothetical protein